VATLPKRSKQPEPRAHSNKCFRLSQKSRKVYESEPRAHRGASNVASLSLYKEPRVKAMPRDCVCGVTLTAFSEKMTTLIAFLCTPHFRTLCFTTWKIEPHHMPPNRQLASQDWVSAYASDAAHAGEHGHFDGPSYRPPTSCRCCRAQRCPPSCLLNLVWR
jgi:hypothetical protein